MIQKLSVCSLLTFSLTCFGQVVTTGGYAANVAPSAALAPITSTPDIALPGSGPAVGAPLGNTNTNDPRFSTGPSIVSRNGMANEPGENSVLNVAGAPEATMGAYPNGIAATNQPAQPTANATSAANQPFDVGIQHFVSGAPDAVNTSASLAEVAKEIRAGLRPPARVITNDTIQQLNARGVRTGNIVPGSAAVDASNVPPPTNSVSNSTPAANSEPRGTLIAQNEAGPMPQSDQAPASSRTVDQRRQTLSAQSSNNSVPAANESADQNVNAAPSNNTGNVLPQTGSSLPLLLLVGFVGLAAGSIYLIRR